LVRLSNTPHNVKIYVIDLKAFLGYPKGGIASSFHLFGHEQYPSESVDQNDSTHDVLQNTLMRVLLSL
jgi:hypothetical protein